RQLARAIRRQAARYVPSHEVRLVARHHRFGRGGGPTPVHQAGGAPLPLTEAEENNAPPPPPPGPTGRRPPHPPPRQPPGETAVRARAAALAPPARRSREGTGGPRLGREPSGYDAHLRWDKAPGAVAYRVFWREAWSPDWQNERTVADAAELVLPDVSIDD